MRAKIYQINTERDIEKYGYGVKFESYKTATDIFLSETVDSSIYDCVYEGEFKGDSLESIYRILNTEHPADYPITAQSLSVSDVVEILAPVSVPGKETIFPGFYYCDNFGFKKVDFEPLQKLHR